jgi:hypothetical protein
LSIEIVTQPGIGPLRASVRMNGYDSSMDGKNPLIGQKGPSRNRSFGGSLGGTLIKNRSTFSLSLNDSNGYNTPLMYATTTAGRIAQNCGCRQPSMFRSFSGLLDYALTKDQTLRIGFGRNSNRSENSGVGGFNNLERGFTTEAAGYNFVRRKSGRSGDASSRTRASRLAGPTRRRSPCSRRRPTSFRTRTPRAARSRLGARTRATSR